MMPATVDRVLNTRMQPRDILPPFEGFVAEDKGGVADRIRTFTSGAARPGNFFVSGGGNVGGGEGPAAAGGEAPPQWGWAGGTPGPGVRLNAVGPGNGGGGGADLQEGVVLPSTSAYFSEFLLLFLFLFVAYILWIQKH